MKRPRRGNTQQNIGWVLMAIFVAFLFIVLLRKKTVAQPSSVTHQLIYHWNSLTDPTPPSFNEAPPFQDANGNLTCALGYSLWQDDRTGNLACYKDPSVGATDHPTGGGPVVSGSIDSTVSQAFQSSPTDLNPNSPSGDAAD